MIFFEKIRVAHLHEAERGGTLVARRSRMTRHAGLGRLRAFALSIALPFGLYACAGVDGDGEPEDIVASEEALTGTITVGASFTTMARVNLREGPSTSETVLLTMPKGVTVTAVEATPRSGFYHVAYGDNDGWAYGAYLKNGSGGATAEGTSSAPTGGTFNGKSYSGVTLLWQGNWSYLVQCDSYSRKKGRVVFFCDESPSRSFVDDGAWIAVPNASFSRSLCGKTARVCKGSRCIVAKVVERSVTAGKWEGSTAVMDALGVNTGFSGCSSSFGTATGVTVTFQ